MEQTRLEQTAAFLRENRSNEANFEALYKRLVEEADDAGADDAYRSALQETKEKWAGEYRTRKTDSGSAWPEFEKFVSGFEKAVTGALKKDTE